MGKSLIIPGADFSANAVERITEVWYTPEADFYELGIASSVISTDFLVDDSSGNIYYMSSWVELLAGKTINLIKVRKNPNVTTPGNLVIGLYESYSSKVDERIIPITEDGYTTYRFEKLAIGLNQRIGLNTSGETGISSCRAAMWYTSITLPEGIDFGISKSIWDNELNHTAFEIQFGYRY